MVPLYLQYDYDKDGMLDVIITTSQAEIHIVSWNGTFITKHQVSSSLYQMYSALLK